MHWIKHYISEYRTDPKRKAIFSIEWHQTASDPQDHIAYIEITVFIRPIVTIIYDGEQWEEDVKFVCNAGSKWDVRANKNRCTFYDSIEIANGLKSFGIGSFIFHSVLNVFIEYFPKASLCLSLSPVDELDEDNKIRRNRMYEKIELIKNKGGTKYSIEHIENLNLKKEFNYIVEINI